MAEKKIPVIIDCDPGIDDAVALMVAFAQPNLDVKAICSVAGNVGVDKTTANARAIVAALGVTCPIYRGAHAPLMPGRVIEAPEAHGVSGLGNFTMPVEQVAPLAQEHAVNAQRRILMDSPEPVTVIAVGPLTNIALLLRMYPEVTDRIARISLMGGGLYTGNHTAAAEFNILADPEAAEIVFQSGLPIVMAGLDVTHKAQVGYGEYELLDAVGNPAADMICRAMQFYFESIPPEERGTRRVSMHDVVSVLAVSQPGLVGGRDLHVAVETAGRYCRGYTLADMRTGWFYQDRPEPNCHVLFEIDRERFVAEILRSAKSYG